MANLRCPSYEEAENMDPDWAPSDNFEPTTLSRPLKRTTGPKKRPGRTPKISDDKLTPRQREKRDARRRRNKEAATRCREKKRDLILELEQKAKVLQSENSKVEMENSCLRDELEKLRAILNSNVGLSNEAECNNEMDQFLDPDIYSEESPDQFPSDLDQFLENLSDEKEQKEPAYKPEEYFANPDFTNFQPDQFFNQDFMAPEKVTKVPVSYAEPTKVPVGSTFVPQHLPQEMLNYDLHDMCDFFD